MLATTEDPPVGQEAAGWRAGLRLPVALGFLLVVTGLAFVRGTGRPRRPSGEPETWKLWLWCGLLVASVVALAAASSHLPPGKTPPFNH
ncbi:MAG: hypothetical protein ACLQNG_08875 [Acidimicrobiales bacterium]|jgi:hypothetical protein